jgi:hypothetical protein
MAKNKKTAGPGRDSMSVAWAEKIGEVSVAMQAAMNDGNCSNANQIGEMIPGLVGRMKAATHGENVPTQQHVLVAMSVPLDVFPPIDGTPEALNDAIVQELCLLMLSDDAASIAGAFIDGYSVDGVVKLSPVTFPAEAFGLVPKTKGKAAKTQEALRPEDEDPSGSRRTVPLGVIGELLSEQGISIGRIKQMTAYDIGLVIDDIRAKLTLLSEIVEHHSDTPQRVLQHMDADAVREHAKFILRAPSVHRDNSECDHQFSMEHDVTGLGDGVLGVTGTCCKCGSTFDHQFKPTEVDWDDRA